MSDFDDTPASSDEREIARVVTGAQEVGTRDGYSGKRHWVRFRAGMRLDICADPIHDTEFEPVTMHDASGGGVSFWSRRKMRDRETIYVREFRADENGEWIAAQVSHCTTGIQGFLIGVRFDNPAPSADTDGSVAQESDEEVAEEAAEEVAEEVVAATAAPTEPGTPSSDAPPRGLRRWFKRRPKD